MPYLSFTQAIAAGAQLNPLDNWNYEFPPQKALLEILLNATGLLVVHNVTTGSENIVPPESPVGAGGVAGVLPARLNNEPIVDMVEPGEKLVLNIKNNSAGTLTVNGVVILTYK